MANQTEEIVIEMANQTKEIKGILMISIVLRITTQVRIIALIIVPSLLSNALHFAIQIVSCNLLINHKVKVPPRRSSFSLLSNLLHNQIS